MDNNSSTIPKITTLIPTFQRPVLLKRAIKSVLRQTYSNLQIKVFDNASGDNTSSIVKDLSLLDSRIKYFCHSSNIGWLANFKFAFQSIDTEYFTVLCDDDFLTKNYYADAIQILDNYADIGFVILETLYVDDKLNLKISSLSNGELKFFRGQDRFDVFHSGTVPITITGIVFRKELASIYLSMHDRFDMGNDIRFTFIAAAKFNFAYLSKVGAIVMQDDQGISAKRQIFSHVDTVLQMERYAEIIFDENIPEYIRNRAKSYLRTMNNRNHEWTFFKIAFRVIIISYLGSNTENERLVNNYISYLKEIDAKIILKFITIGHNNLLIKILFSPIIYILRAIRVYKRTENTRNLLFQQEVVYKALFEDIRHI